MTNSNTRARRPIDPTKAPACFAPPLGKAEAANYRTLAEGLDEGPTRDAMLSLVKMAEAFNETPESKEPGVKLQVALFDKNGAKLPAPDLVPLEQAEVERIWDLVPWPHELNAMGQLFHAIPSDTQKALRNAAFHLLWLGRELVLDREPLTNDKL